MFKKALSRMCLVGMLGAGAAGCATNAGTGALVGGASGAGLGAILSHGHPGGAILGGALGAVTGAVIGNEADREDYRDRYSDHRGYYYDSPGRVYERRTTYVNPDGTTTTYIDRTYR